MPPVTIIGVSLGGMIGLQFALNHPNRVRGVMMVSTLGGVEVRSWSNSAATMRLTSFSLRLP